MFDINGYFSWKKFGICAAIAAIAVVAIAATVVTCGAASGAGMVVGFHYNNEYFYSRDLTGNISKILDANGKENKNIIWMDENAD